jgi:L-amino acid N-acyltransferase YncA
MKQTAARHPDPHHRHRLIRLATAADGLRLAQIYRPAVVDLATSFELEPPDGAEMARRVAAITGRTPWLVAEVDGTTLGYAYASPHRERAAYVWSVEVSAYVDPAAQRLGLARAMYAALFRLLELQGFQNAYAGIALPNPASAAFHEALGFKAVGTYHRVGFKHGAWHDVRWYERSVGPHPGEPAPPRPLPQIMGEPAFGLALAAESTPSG